MDTAQKKKIRETPVFLKYALGIMGVAVSAALVIVPLSELNSGSEHIPLPQDQIVVAELPEISQPETPTVSSKDRSGTIVVQEPIRPQTETLDGTKSSQRAL